MKRANKRMKHEFQVQTKIVQKYFKMNTNFILHLNNLVFTIILYKICNRVFLQETSKQTHKTCVFGANKDWGEIF